MGRAIILLFDSFGVGYSLDADKFGDVGADTLGHINEWCAKNRKNSDGSVNYLHLPNLDRLGLGLLSEASRGVKLSHSLGGLTSGENSIAAYSYAEPTSRGKDTLSGHWEITGVPVDFEWGYFPDVPHCFPPELVSKLVKKGNIPGVLGEKHASGTVILKELGEEHIATGKPIVYTSGDSVLQIAAHEKYFGLERLYDLCKMAFDLVKPYKIARVIARPFIGETADTFVRTGNRHDYALAAPGVTLLDEVVEQGGEVHAIGKISDIFAYRNISKSYHATGLKELFDTTLEAIKNTNNLECNSLVFTNFVDFDSIYGHRRDVEGYAKGLEYLDTRLPELLKVLNKEDVLLITADHGCDPTWKGTDHTREKIPVIFYGEKIKPGAFRKMRNFSDIGQTLAFSLHLLLNHGTTHDIYKD
jgi:phosphopentomutase